MLIPAWTNRKRVSVCNTHFLPFCTITYAKNEKNEFIRFWEPIESRKSKFIFYHLGGKFEENMLYRKQELNKFRGQTLVCLFVLHVRLTFHWSFSKLILFKTWYFHVKQTTYTISSQTHITWRTGEYISHRNQYVEEQIPFQGFLELANKTLPLRRLTVIYLSWFYIIPFDNQ